MGRPTFAIPAKASFARGLKTIGWAFRSTTRSGRRYWRCRSCPVEAGLQPCVQRLWRRGFSPAVEAVMKQMMAIAVVLWAGATVARAQSLDLHAYRILDLSHSFDEQTIYWPTAPSKFELKPLAFGKTAGGYFYSSFGLCTPEHGGTSLDAPLHFAEGHPSIGDVPLDRLMGPAVVIDVSKQAAGDPVYRLSP